MAIAIAAEDNAVHESHVISSLALNLDRRALRHVRSHSMDKQMGQDKSLDSAALRCEALPAEILREEQCLQHDHEYVDSDPLLTDFECCPPGKIHNTYFKFICGLSQQLPLVLQTLGSSQDAMLPVCVTSHVNLSTCWRTRDITRIEYVRWVWN